MPEFSPTCPTTGEYCPSRARCLAEFDGWAVLEDLWRERVTKIHSSFFYLPARLFNLFPEAPAELNAAARQRADFEGIMELNCSGAENCIVEGAIETRQFQHEIA